MRISTYLSQFQDWLDFNGKAESTSENYLKRIKRFIKEIGDLEVKDIKKEHLINWVVLLRNRAKEGYIINCLWAMRSFLKFLKEDRGLDVWHFQDLKIPKKKIPEYIEYLKNEEVKKLINSISLKDVYGLRMRAYLEVLLNTGLRPGEALNLNRDVADRKETEILGKGNKKRIVYFNDRVLYWIRRYVKTRKDNELALFTTHCKPKRLSLRMAEDSFHKYICMSGIEKRVRLHDLRHTYGTNLLKHGCPTEYIMRLLGHSKPETTRTYYLSISREDVKSAHFKYLDYRKGG